MTDLRAALHEVVQEVYNHNCANVDVVVDALMPTVQQLIRQAQVEAMIFVRN